jgi:hypothetical protein
MGLFDIAGDLLGEIPGDVLGEDRRRVRVRDDAVDLRVEVLAEARRPRAPRATR